MRAMDGLLGCSYMVSHAVHSAARWLETMSVGGWQQGMTATVGSSRGVGPDPMRSYVPVWVVKAAVDPRECRMHGKLIFIYVTVTSYRHKYKT